MFNKHGLQVVKGDGAQRATRAGRRAERGGGWAVGCGRVGRWKREEKRQNTREEVGKAKERRK